MASFKNIYCKDTGEKVKTYTDYLRTDHWKNLRKQIIEKYGGECQRCHDIVGESGNVHHKTYKRLGHERLTDLTLYCNKCHKILHNKRISDKSITAKLIFTVQQMDYADKEKVLQYAEHIAGL